MESDGRVFIIGEDLLDPYGGAFKVTQGLSSAFPDRTLTTPVSEAGFLGAATGMALRGLRPVVEIMFGDFTTLITDQVINHLAKFRYMYNEQLHVPLVIRTPMGGRRGYGPTHSQTLEKLFLGIPGLRIIAPCSLDDPGQLLLQAILEDDDPVIFIENKLLYTMPVLNVEDLDEFNFNKIEPELQTTKDSITRNYAPAYHLTLRGAPNPTVTIAAYGYMADLCRQSALKLAYEDEIFSEIVILTQLSPFAIDPILNSVKSTHQLLVAEEGTYTMGWGAEILARTVEILGRELFNAGRVAGRDLPIPASGPLEKEYLPDAEDIIQSIKRWYK
jgi:pyruvate/2-oxoglutarate/acetoin dehydrogenase E1 component